jgi:predicted RNA binding protein YcfA (HicA-like mRNA interferase family)
MSLSDLPDASGLEHTKALQKFGWVTRRNAAHIIMTHANSAGVTLSIPNHKTVKRATLHRILRSAGIADSLYRQVFDTL